MLAGRISRRFASKSSLILGSAYIALSFAPLAGEHRHPCDLLIAAALLGIGIGIGLAFAALANLVVQAVPAHQSGVATGMNTVMRTLGGAVGGQLSATFIAGHVAHGLPTVTGFTETFVMATAFLIVCVLSGLLVPGWHPVTPAAQPIAAEHNRLATGAMDLSSRVGLTSGAARAGGNAPSPWSFCAEDAVTVASKRRGSLCWLSRTLAWRQTQPSA